MSELEINDLDFYQTDHTNASSWEAFNFNLEEVLSNHRNYQRNFEVKAATGQFTTRKETIRFQDLQIEVTLYLAKEESSGEDKSVLVEGSFTFSGDEISHSAPPLWKWYGLTAFIVVSTANDDVIPEQQTKTIQSSVQMSVAEINCSTPVFLRVMNRKANMFLGVSDEDHVRTNYDMIFLRALPPNYKHFTGLYDMFKGKVLSTDPIEVAVRLCFSTNELKDFTELGRRSDADELKYPFGIETDPIKFLVLNCVWSELPTTVVVHNSTNFEATKADKWILQCVFDDSPIEIMSDFIEEFTENLMSEDVLVEKSEVEYAFQGAFAKPKRTWSKLRTEKVNQEEATIPDEVVKKFLYYLFPDADKDNTDPMQYDDLDGKTVTLSKMKTAPKDSLIHRLALVLALAYNNFGNEYGLKYFWREFFMEMRYRVDNCIEIPGISKGFPDYHTCLLHQKLQMVNVCIDRRRQRMESAQSTRESSNESNKTADSEEEFYDCEEDELRLIKPTGRLSPLGELRLVGHPEETLYIPETQDAVVKTEDELENDADVMLKLGPGSDLSSQMMSLSLQSDMESFKAANPMAKIEDFIRWYSPRDWIEDEATGKGEISERMKIPGNTWQTVWAAARAIPAMKQKCLFDDAKEAEKVMFYLEHMRVGELIYMILPCLMEGAFETLAKEMDCFKQVLLAGDENEMLTKRMPMLMDLICKYSREYWSGGNKTVAGPKWKFAVHEMRRLENVVTTLRSICEKLGEDGGSSGGANGQLVRGLMSGRPTVVPGGPSNERWKEILQLFSQSQEADGGGDLSSAETEREFVFRMQKRVGGEVILPQFMRVLLKPNSNEYRICGAFSQHVNIEYC